MKKETKKIRSLEMARKKIRARRLMEIEKAIECRMPMGVPQPYLLDLFKELGCGKRELNKFYKWMDGQTCGLVGNIPVYYKSDLFRFLANDCDKNTEVVD